MESIGDVEDLLRRTVCRVDYGGNQLGTAFIARDSQALTAYHVIRGVVDEELILWFDDDTQVQATVLSTWEDADIARLRLEEDNPTGGAALPVAPERPRVKDEVAWCGFARLIGEPKIERRRYGWGRIASPPYAEDGGVFFEVSGEFNPGHSGGPIVRADTGELIGIVAATAGGFDELAEAWQEKAQAIRTLQQLGAQMQSGGGFVTTWQHEDPEQAIAQRNALQSLGLDPDMEAEDDGTIHISLQRSQIPFSIAERLGELAVLQMRTIRRTFQMGVGIGTGGDPLARALDD